MSIEVREMENEEKIVDEREKTEEKAPKKKSNKKS